jgi:hypothetical protein
MDSNNRYGYDFSEIHKWMDEPSMVAGSKHRIMRHDPFKTPEEAEKIFWDKVPLKQRQNIKHAVVDHIKLDVERTSSKVQNYHMETITNQMIEDTDKLIEWLNGKSDGNMTITDTHNANQTLSELVDKGIKMVLNWYSFTKDLELNIEYRQRLKQMRNIVLDYLENQIYSVIYTSLKRTLKVAIKNPDLEFTRKQRKVIKKFFKKWDRFDDSSKIKGNNDYLNLKNEIIKLDENGVLPEFCILLTKVEKKLKYERLKEKLQMCYKKITEEKEGEFKISVNLNVDYH